MNLLTTELREYVNQRDCLLAIADLHCTTTETYFHYMAQVDEVESIIKRLSLEQLKKELKLKEAMETLEANGQGGLEL